jgi:hypothetical protein
MVLSQLQTLKPMLGTQFKTRVKFVVLCFTHKLTTSLVRYEYYDKYGIGERDFDACFEMGDSSEVIQAVLKRLGSSAQDIIDREMGQGSYQQWLDSVPPKSLF